MGFVHPDKHDVFVSYAHADDVPYPGESEGWVATFLRHLLIALNQRLGRRELYSLWSDKRLAGDVAFTPEIMGNLRESAVFLAIASPGYLASTWCLQEFVEGVRGREGGRSRHYLVKHWPAPGGPEELDKFKGYQFYTEDQLTGKTRGWGPEPNKMREHYVEAVEDLATEIARELNDQKKAREAGRPRAPAAAPRATVYLAHVTEDLVPSRNQIRRDLEGRGLRVVPDAEYPRDAEGFRRRAKADMAEALLFVQLLDDLPGESPRRFVAVQHELALERKAAVGKFDILQWRHCDLDLKGVGDPAHLALLTGPTTLTLRFENDFKPLIVQRVEGLLRPPPVVAAEPPPVDDAIKRVFVNAEKKDLALAREVGTLLSRMGAWVAFPLSKGSPTELREDLDRKLQECNGTVLIHGKTKATWVSEQLNRLSRPVGNPPRNLSRKFRLYQGPPAEKDQLDELPPARFVIPSHAAPDEGRLLEFLNEL